MNIKNPAESSPIQLKNFPHANYDQITWYIRVCMLSHAFDHVNAIVTTYMNKTSVAV